ncbi:DNA replication/repair protein RecF [Methylomonas sp. SURF-2]|uniref:DNA replication and repair protein RecF n=1 Tax=Methylomonas subterranea TaxID=2952225 RepID=A0ABT1TJ34_9GAMM|nr:DNA replication/repair protein RecF [Methylomonas sp. SURF-2]MCQ8105473.1 DNA replication/repair protein RecF [Methylomonas sp. SURF-2]
MTLLKLDVISVRNIHSATIQPSPSLNFVTGANASGKSSLLEAIFILGRARSFRTQYVKQAIGFDRTQLIVAAQHRQHQGSVASLGIQISAKQTEIRIDQENRQKADLAYLFPVQLIHPKSYRLLDAGPQNRREFLDWGIFNHNRNFLPNWRNFSKALQQRNALLKNRQLKQVPAWDRELIEYGAVVNALRKEYVQLLAPVFLDMAGHFLDTSQIELRFSAGWDEQLDLERMLVRNLDRDLRYGFTHAGPHRADFLTFHNQRLAKDYLSRGQQKLLVLALLLSQVSLLNSEARNNCCILVDDLTAELDTVNRAKLLKYLANLGCQVFITSTGLSDFGDLSTLNNYKVFHVEQGCIQQL